jgi:hypothetical protein
MVLTPYLGFRSPVQGLLFRMRGIIREFKRTPFEASARSSVRYAAAGGAGVEYFSLRIPQALLEGIERALSAQEALTDEEVDFIVNYDHGALAR